MKLSKKHSIDQDYYSREAERIMRGYESAEITDYEMTKKCVLLCQKIS